MKKSNFRWLLNFSVCIMICLQVNLSFAHAKSINIKDAALYFDSLLSKETISNFLTDSTALKRAAIAAVQDLDQSNHYIDYLTPGDLNTLPVGLKKTIGNITYKIAISSAVFHSDYAELTVFAKVEIPQEPKELFFGISGLKFSYEGGITGDAKLSLLGNIPININGGNAQVILRGGFNIDNGQPLDDLTYITMDCNGFKQLGLAADVVFPRSILIPCDDNGDQISDESQKVTGSFKTVVQDWNDILVNINLPKFQINKINDVVFTVSNATFDFSDTRNGSNVVFPADYQMKYMNFPNPYMWRGVFIQTLEVMLPKAFSRKSGSQRVVFGANNLIIDNNGVTGSFYGKNILPYNEGSASGWKFSVDEFDMDIEANTLISAGFKGSIGLPVADKDSLNYTAIIAPDNKYLLTVSPKGKMDFDLWQAHVQLDSNSYIKLLVDNGKFLPEANLYGSLDIGAKTSASSSKPLADFKGITFRGLHLKTTDPYLTVDYFGYNGEVKIANFPVSIDNIALTASGAQTTLSFGVGLTLMDNSFKAHTRLNIKSDLSNSAGIQKWAFNSVGLSEIDLQGATTGGMTLNGTLLLLQDDPTYGNGFRGNIKAEFLNKISVQVRAIFGNNGYRYWFVDGKVDWGNGIPLIAPFNLKGFSGGAYYRMSKINLNAPSSGGGLPQYKPDSMMGLGVEAGVLFNVASSTVVDGEADFEIAFNKSGGINYIGFFGYAKFMGEIPVVGSLADAAGQFLYNADKKIYGGLEKLSETAKLDSLKSIQKLRIDNPQKAAELIPTNADFSSGVSAYVGINYDFPNQTFHANLDIYVNTAGGLLQGTGTNYRAGWAVFHFQPGLWYVYAGTPSDPIGLKIGIGSIGLKADAYLMTGSQIPGSPPPPQEVADILGVQLEQLDYMRDLNALGDGRGFAFGTHLSVQTGDITFLILYANFKAGIGFDLMLKQYADAHCEGSNNPIGINGWYANAQAYAYLQGELGVKVHLLFINMRIPIISGGVAALLQAKLPNPTWFQGYLGVQFNVLGGLVKGRANFRVKIGNECTIVGSGMENPLGISVIADVTPKDSVNVDVFTAPQVALNFPVDRDIPISDNEGNKTFRVKLETFTLSKNGQNISGQIQWNNNKDAATFVSDEILSPNTPIKLYAKVSFLQLVNGNWQTVYLNGKPATEDRTLNFVTGTAPQSIPLTNIEYSWPVVSQNNFYKGETNKGYVQLKRGQSYLFNVPGYNQTMVFKKENGNAINTAFSYDSVNRLLNFDIPDMDLNSSYSCAINSVPVSASANTDKTNTNAQTQQNVSSSGDTLITTINNNTAQNVTRSDTGITILGYSFHSSAYKTFAEKVQSINISGSIVGRISFDVISLQNSVGGYEPFDVSEIEGTAYTSNVPLIQPVALLDNDYYTKDIYPLNYKIYPVGNNIVLTNRDTADLGLAPVRALPVALSYQSAVEQGNFNTQFVNQRLPYIYDLPRIYKADFIDLQNQVVNRYLGTPQQAQYEWLISGSYPFMRQGQYNVKYQFVLPGKKDGSSAIVPYQNPIQQ